jgi:hypothetical protein
MDRLRRHTRMWHTPSRACPRIACCPSRWPRRSKITRTVSGEFTENGAPVTFFGRHSIFVPLKSANDSPFGTYRRHTCISLSTPLLSGLWSLLLASGGAHATRQPGPRPYLLKQNISALRWRPCDVELSNLERGKDSSCGPMTPRSLDFRQARLLITSGYVPPFQPDLTRLRFRELPQTGCEISRRSRQAVNLTERPISYKRPKTFRHFPIRVVNDNGRCHPYRRRSLRRRLHPPERIIGHSENDPRTSRTCFRSINPVKSGQS